MLSCPRKFIIIALLLSSYLKSQYVPLFTLENHGPIDRVTSIIIDNDTIITGNADNSVRQYDKYSGKFLRTVARHGNGILSLAIYNDILVVSDYNTVVYVYNKITGKLIKELRGHRGRVYSVAIDKDYIVTGSQDKTARIYDTKTGEFIAALTYHTSDVTCVALDADTILTSSTDKTIRLYDKHTRELSSKIVGDMGAGQVIIDNDIIFKGAWEEIQVHNKKTGELLKRVPGAGFMTAAMAIDRDIIVAGYWSGRCSDSAVAAIHDKNSGKLLQEFNRSDHVDAVAVDKDIIIISSSVFVPNGTANTVQVYQRPETDFLYIDQHKILELDQQAQALIKAVQEKPVAPNESKPVVVDPNFIAQLIKSYQPVLEQYLNYALITDDNQKKEIFYKAFMCDDLTMIKALIASGYQIPKYIPRAEYTDLAKFLKQHFATVETLYLLRANSEESKQTLALLPLELMNYIVSLLVLE